VNDPRRPGAQDDPGAYPAQPDPYRTAGGSHQPAPHGTTPAAGHPAGQAYDAGYAAGQADVPPGVVPRTTPPGTPPSTTAGPRSPAWSSAGTGPAPP
jgi:hypothetical protein